MSSDSPDSPLVDASWPFKIASHGEFVAAVHDTVARARHHGVRRMVWADTDFADWPLDDVLLWPKLLEWLKLPQRRLVLLANDYGQLAHRCPRFVAGYRSWSHAIQAFSPDPGDVGQLPSLLVAEGAAVVRLTDRQHWRGRASCDAAESRASLDQLDVLLQRSSPTFAVTTLGL